MSNPVETESQVFADSAEARALAAAAILSGGVIAFLTDTFYGLGADPMNRASLRSIFLLKGRAESKPVLVVVADLAAADILCAERTPVFECLAREFWPGPLTLVVRAREEVPVELTAGTGTVGIRLPADEAVASLVRLCGGCLTATSANLSGEPPAASAADVLCAFPRGIAVVLDGGAAQAAQPSTVVDVTGNEARLIREGAISGDDLRECLLKSGLPLTAA